MTTLNAGFTLMGLGLGGVFIVLLVFYFFLLGCVRIAKRQSRKRGE